MTSAQELARKELSRIVKPFDVDEIFSALQDKPSVFSRDAVWQPHHLGRPRRCDPKEPAFDQDALVAGAVSICYLAAQLPVGDPWREALPRLADSLRTRLANPNLLLFGGLARNNRPLPKFEGQPYQPPLVFACAQTASTMAPW